MATSENNYERLVSMFRMLFDEILQKQFAYKRGLLGNHSGDVWVSGRPNYVWIREDKDSSRVFRVWNTRVAGIVDTPVIYGVLAHEPNKEQVIDVDWASYSQQDWGEDGYPFNAVALHGGQHQYAGEESTRKGIDPVLIYQAAMQTLKTLPYTSLQVKTQPYIYMVDGTRNEFLGAYTDLLGYRPSTTGNAVQVLVYLNKSTNLIGTIAGTEYGTGTTANYPSVPAGTTGQESAYVYIQWNTTGPISATDIIDTRDFLGGAGSTGSYDTAIGLEPWSIDSGETLTIPDERQLTIHDHDLTVDGDIVVDGALLLYEGHLVDVPSSATGTGNRGDYAVDSSYLYVCWQENNWKRVGISSW